MRALAFALALLLLLYGQARVYANAISWGRPPASCQLLGGSWDAWEGWRCG